MVLTDSRQIDATVPPLFEAPNVDEFAHGGRSS